MTDGIETSNLPLRTNIDEFIGNYDSGSGKETVRVSKQSLIAQFTRIPSVTDFGADPTGSSNSTSAFNNALSSISSGYIGVPPGKYKIDPITVGAYKSIVGLHPGPFDGDLSVASAMAPTILCNSDSGPLVTLSGYQSNIENILFYYPTSGVSKVQRAPNAGIPIQFNPTIRTDGAGGHFIRRCTFINSYDAIDINVGRCAVQDCNIGAMHRGIIIDNAYDTVSLKNVNHQIFWDIYSGINPFTSPSAFDAWTLNNGVAVESKKCDNLKISNMFVFCRYAGFSFIDGSGGNTYGTGSDIELDYVAFGIVAVSTNSGAHGMHFNNLGIGSNSLGVGTPGQATIKMYSGGSEPPRITWNGGHARGLFSYGSFYPSIDNVSGSPVGLAWISNVRGINDGNAVFPPTVPASGSSIRNPYSFAVRIGLNCSGGSISNFTVNGNGTGIVGTSGTFLIMPNETISVTYTGTLAWAWFAA